jgi:hypothetical protein
MAMDYENTELTGVSFSQDMPMPSSERRRDNRYMSVYRVATLRTSRFCGLCLIRNISGGGLMGTVHKVLPVSAAVAVEIEADNPIAGRIVWTKDTLIGVKFDAPIDVLQILHCSTEQTAGRKHRMPRLMVDCIARVLVGGVSREIRVVDISQGGAKVEADFLGVGDQLIIAINGLEPCRGVICWVEAGRAGISFNAPLAFNSLASWASHCKGAARES